MPCATCASVYLYIHTSVHADFNVMNIHHWLQPSSWIFIS